MILLNAGFGILAFLPQSWLYMIGLILLECFGLSYLLDNRWFDLDVTFSVVIANLVSGVIGILGFLLLTGGFVMVVWFPWVAYYRIFAEDMEIVIAIVYLMAFILTLSIEAWINHRRLRKGFPKNQILRGTLIVNLISYFVGACLLFTYDL